MGLFAGGCVVCPYKWAGIQPHRKVTLKDFNMQIYVHVL
jgi:hypothetical protein